MKEGSGRFLEQLAVAWQPAEWGDFRVVVAVSGGADSVALLRGLHAIRRPGSGRIVVAHFNHGLRQEAAHDERFVEKLAEQLGLPIEVGRGDVRTAAEETGDGLEAAARQARYAFLLDAAERVGARYVVTAHTADDQAETILHRVLRGTGIAGLAGMPRARQLSDAVTLIRPLLGIRRQAAAEYLREIGAAHVQDASNFDLRHTRNRIRQELLPQLATYNADVLEALLRLGLLAGEAQEILQTSAVELSRRCAADLPGGFVIDCRKLLAAPRYLVREMFVQLWQQRGWPLQAMGFDEWEALATLALDPHDTPQRFFPGRVLAKKQGEQLTLTRLAE